MVGAILTLGLGSFGSVNLLPTLGYVSAEEAEITAGPYRFTSAQYHMPGQQAAHHYLPGHKDDQHHMPGMQSGEAYQ